MDSKTIVVSGSRACREFFSCFAGKDLSVTVMLNVQGALNANSRKFIESWKSKVSNSENPGNAENSAKPEKPD